MKFTFWLLFPILLFNLSACEDDNPTPNEGSSPVVFQNTFFLKKDGVPFNPVHTGFGQSGFDNMIGIYAAASSSSFQDSYSFMISKDLPAGEYDLETLYDYGFFFSYSDENLESFNANSGVFKVLHHDTVSGVMQALFTMEIENADGEIHQITQGQFTCNY